MAEQTEIAYEGKEWQSYQTGGTLIRAVDLNNMEQGISDACAGVDELRTKRLPTYVVAQDGDTATQDVYTEDILGPCLILDLATRTTYYETGGDEEGHRKAITSGDDIDDLRDSLSQAPLDRRGNLLDVTFAKLSAIEPGAYTFGDGSTPVAGHPSGTGSTVPGSLLLTHTSARRVLALAVVDNREVYVTSGSDADNWLRIS